jgi:hypothetical protein
MKTFRFAVASIHYHKKALILYALLAFFAVIGLIISDTLLHSLNQLFSQAKNYVIDEDMPAKIVQEIQPIATIYQNLFLLIFASFLLVFTGFTIFYQQMKRKEFQAWLTSGASSRQWIGMQLLEVLIPLMAIVLFVFALLILFQPFFQQEMITSHITTFEREDASVQVWQSIKNQTTSDFGITIPQTSQAFIQNIELNSTEWLSMILKSLRQTVVLLCTSVTIITLVVASSHCFYWRNQQWKNQKIN